MAGPRLPDVNTIIQAGINPKTGLPLKMGEQMPESPMRMNMDNLISTVDRQDAINRYVWYGLPDGLTGQMIESILYYCGQACLFYNEADNKFYFLPYALDGEIDVYGRFLGITPIPYRGGSTTLSKDNAWIKGKVLEPIYDVMYETPTWKDYTTKCVLLKDYSRGTSETIVPRCTLQRPLIESMSKIVPYLTTTLSNSTGVGGMHIEDDDASWQVEMASLQAEKAALNGKKWIGIKSNLTIEPLTSDKPASAQEFLMAMQSLDNYRLAMYGLSNGGLFEKSAHMLQTEANAVYGMNDLVMQDGTTLRQDFCLMAASLFGLAIWCEPAEQALGQDRNGDGTVGNDNGGVGQDNTTQDAATDGGEQQDDA